MSAAYERFLEPLERDLRALPLRSLGLVFAFGAERLLPLYESFAAAAGWGTPRVLRAALDWIWSPEEKIPPEGTLSWIDQIAQMTPNGDDHPTLEGLWAQDACVATDSAVRGVGGLGIGAEAVWYCFEPLHATICDELTGALDVGSGADAEETERRVITDPRMLTEMGEFVKVVGILRREAGADVEVKTLAEASRWSPEKIRRIGQE
jgi:hypothetical protein